MLEYLTSAKASRIPLTSAPSVLIIFAYHFPPENAVGSLRPFRFYKYLTRRGLDCHVITAARGAATDGFNEIRDPFGIERGLGNIVELGIRKIFLPGAMGIRWSGQAQEAAERLLVKHRGSAGVVFSSYPPLGPHLAAWRISSRLRLPWIADFRDPLGTALSDKYFTSTRQKLLLGLEEWIMRRARFVLANTDAAADRLRNLYPEHSEKVHLVWNGFDPEDRIRPRSLTKRPYKMITHVGELYSGRTVKPIIESIARLIGQQRLRANEVRLRLVGPADHSCLPTENLLESAQAEGWLEFTNELIPKEEANKIAADSDGLLLLQPQSALQVPGKLFEYLQLRHPILAFVARQSPSERILSQCGVPYRAVYPDSKPSQWDDSIAEFIKLRGEYTAGNGWFEQHFNVEHQTRFLHDLIEQCAKRR
jgi:glycosyltransferase involved in cell wall biosynthesis